MNNDQRKFLVKTIEDKYKQELEKLHDSLPKRPSLNNYLVAAALDGTIKVKTTEEIKEAIRQKVLKFGASDSLIQEHSSYNYRRNTDRTELAVELRADELFEFPQAYLDAEEKYKSNKIEVQKKTEALTRKKDSLILKVQIGSNQSLDKLVNDVDSMIDIGLLNEQLMLDKE